MPRALSRHALPLAYALILLWINVYICRELFQVEDTGHRNAMHGFWMAMARLASHHWWTPGWWPYWDAGMPFEYTYSPLVPGLTAFWSKLAGVSIGRAFHTVIGCVYVLTPISLFAMGFVLSGRAGWSFAAGVVYSVLSITQLIVPDEPFAWGRIGDARRLYLAAVWDEAPHLAALTFLPLAVLFLTLAIESRKRRYWIACGAAMCLMLLSNAFGTTMLAIAILCFLLARGTAGLLGIFGVSICTYLAVCPFLPPSLFPAISRNQQLNGAVKYDAGSFTALAIVIAGCLLLRAAFRRWRPQWWLAFFSYFTWITLAIPFIAGNLQRTFLPQPARYKVEAELGLSLLAVFALRPLLERLPAQARVGLALIGVSLAAEQVINHRKFAKNILAPAQAASSIEYRVAKWTAENMPDARVWLPGSLAQWFNTWTDGWQMTGSSWSTSYNAVHQRLASRFIYASSPQDADHVFLWLKAYGVQAAVIPGPNSPEFWKALRRSDLFSGCEILWRQDDTNICRVPGVSGSLAHVLARDAMVLREPRDWNDTSDVRRFALALDTAVDADWQWRGTDEAILHGNIPAGSAVAIQVTHHPGWHAKANGNPIPVKRDGLGLMWLDSPCAGPCEIQLEYNGGWELRLCRWISALTLLGIAAWVYRTFKRVTVRSPQES
jgi:hypothetical protein